MNRKIMKIITLVILFCFVFTSTGFTEIASVAMDSVGQAIEENVSNGSYGDIQLQNEPGADATNSIYTNIPECGSVTYWEDMPEDIRPLILDMANFDGFSDEDREKLLAFLSLSAPQPDPSAVAKAEELDRIYQENKTLAIEAFEICLNNDTISECTQEQINNLCVYFDTSENQLGSFAERPLLEIYHIYDVANRYTFSAQDASIILGLYPQMPERYLELDQLKRFLDYSDVNVGTAKNFFVSGYDTNEIESAFLNEYLFGTQMGQVIEHFDETTPLSNEISTLSIENNEFLSETLQKYHLIPPNDIISTFANDISNNAEEKLRTYERNKLASLSATGTTINNVKNDIISPYSIANSNTESISLNNGSLNFSNNLVNNSLQLHYNSSNANLLETDFGYTSYSNYAIVYARTISYDYPASHTYPAGTKIDIIEGPFIVNCSSYSQMISTYNQYNGTKNIIPNTLYDISPLVSGGFAKDWVNDVTTYWDKNGNVLRTEQSSPAPEETWYTNEDEYEGVLDRGETKCVVNPVVTYSDGSSSQLVVWTATFSGNMYYCPPSFDETYYAEKFVDSYSDAYNTTNKTTYTEKSNNLGSGWKWNIPSIEIDEYKILHLRDGESYRVDSSLAIKNYTLRDKVLSENTTYIAGQVPSKYLLKYKTGEKIYFGADGRILCEQDRLGNTTKYEHTTINAHPVVSKIIDSLGRITTITYTNTATGRDIVIKNPDDTTSRITLEEIPNHTDEYILKKITDPINRETLFNYNYVVGNFSYTSKTPSMNNTCANLIDITYPTGAKAIYTYEQVIENLGSSGAVYAYRIKTREDKIGTISSNKKAYTYTGNPTGYPTYSDPNSLPEASVYDVSITDENGLKQKFTFNNKHLNTKSETFSVTGTTEKALSKVESIYDTDKLLTSNATTAYNGANSTSRVATERYTYDTGKFGDLLSYTDPMNTTVTYIYDSIWHQVSKKVTPINTSASNTVNYTIDPTNGNISKMVNGNLTVDYLYDARGNTTKITSKDTTANRTSVEDFEYSDTYEGGFLTKKSAVVKDYLNVSETVEELYEYDFLSGLLTKTIHPNGSFSTYTYDTIGRETEITLPQITGEALTSITTVYDDINQITTETDEIGYKVRVVFDELGRELKKEELMKNEWVTLETSEYNNLSQVISVTNALGNKTQSEYDKLGRAIKVVNPDNTFKIVTHYDGEGKVVSTNEDGHTKTVYKDLVGRTVKEETTNAGVVSTVMYEYDKVGNVVKVTDANNNITTNVYDSRGRISSVSNTVDGVGNITSYSYDGYSNILKETYPNGNTKTTLYDELNRAIRVVDALNKIEYVKYDKMGNIVKIIDRKGGIVTFEYDTRGRLTKRTAGTIIELTAYDKVDRITAKTGSSGTRTYEYFANGQLKKETNEDSKSIQYEYDVLGRKTEMSDYYGETTTYGYNSLNKLISVRGIGTIYYEYYPDGMLKKKTSGSEVFHLYTYNSLNQLTKLEHENSNGLLSTYDYTYDKNGNELTKKTTKDGKVKTEIYTYDVLNRVKTSNDGTSVVTFYYDKNGNITKEAVVVSGATVNTVYTYDANNRLLKKTVGTGDILEFYYDNNGNLINKAQGAATGTGELSAHAWGEGPVAELGKTAIYEYNALNQLVKYSDLKGVNVSYSYSVTGLRDTKTYNGNAIKYYYDGENVVNESTNGTQSATNLNGLQTELRNKDSFEDMYLMYDGHGDVASLRTYSGLFEGASYEYDIYGKEEVVTGTFDNPIRYTGQYYDAETGMYYLRARYYDPDVRRFISEDTHWNVNNMIYGDRVYQDGEIRIPDIAAIMQSRNLYGYCMGNPVRYIDPSGLRTYVLNGINNGKPEGSPEDVEAFAQSLRDGGVKDVRTIGVYNGTGIFDGAGQAIMEMLNNGKYADAVATKIKEDLKNNPLADGEQLNIVGYSGGGQIAFNAAEKMAGTKKIDNVVLIGAPVMELISNVNKTVSIWAGWDPLSWNIGWGVTFRFAGWFGHTSYFNDKNRGNVAGIANEYIN